MSNAKAVVFFVLLTLSQNIVAKNNIYLDITSNKELLSIDDDPRFITYSGHVGYQWVTCEFNGVCLASRNIIISLPYREDDRWVIAGVEFKRATLGKVSLLGAELGEGYKVTSVQGRVRYEFIYSKLNGLVAISAYSKDQKQKMVISQSRCGFGAHPTCEEKK